MGVSSKASRSLTSTLGPSIAAMCTRCSPIGFGLSSDLELNTPHCHADFNCLITMSLVQLWCLNEADDVAVCVLDGGERLASRFARPALVNGAAGAVWAPGGRPRVVFGFKVTGGKIVEIDLIADPPRLRQLDLDVLDCWGETRALIACRPSKATSPQSSLSALPLLRPAGRAVGPDSPQGARWDR